MTAFQPRVSFVLPTHNDANVVVPIGPHWGVAVSQADQWFRSFGEHRYFVDVWRHEAKTLVILEQNGFVRVDEPVNRIVLMKKAGL
jgi:hypothetical protein